MDEEQPPDKAATNPPSRKPRTGKRKIAATGTNRNGRNGKLAIQSDYGPAMSSLTALQQRFVEGLIEHPTMAKAPLLRLVGYDGTDDGCKQMCVRLMRNPVVLDAIQEIGRAYLRGIVPDAVNSLRDVITNPKHRDHVKATLALMDRTGLHAVSESKQTVTHTFDRESVIAKIAAIMERNQSLLPALPVPTEKPVNLIEAQIVEREAVKSSD